MVAAGAVNGDAQIRHRRGRGAFAAFSIFTLPIDMLEER